MLFDADILQNVTSEEVNLKKKKKRKVEKNETKVYA